MREEEKRGSYEHLYRGRPPTLRTRPWLALRRPGPVQQRRRPTWKPTGATRGGGGASEPGGDEGPGWMREWGRTCRWGRGAGGGAAAAAGRGGGGSALGEEDARRMGGDWPLDGLGFSPRLVQRANPRKRRATRDKHVSLAESWPHGLLNPHVMESFIEPRSEKQNYRSNGWGEKWE